MVARQESKLSRLQQVKAKSDASLSLTEQAICSNKKIDRTGQTKMAVIENVQLPIRTFLLSIVTLLLMLGRLVEAKDVVERYKPKNDPCKPNPPPCLPSGQSRRIERYEGEFAEIKCLVYERSSNQIKRFVKFGRAGILPPIAVGREVFLDRDKRYSVVHQNGSALWTFVIDFLRQSDAGHYECNDEGDVVTYTLVVLPLPPATRFLSYGDGKDMYVDIPNFVREGSSFQVSCFCKVGTGEDTVLEWYKDDIAVSTSSDKGIKIAKGWYDTHGGELGVTMKFLYAIPQISGVYECRCVNEERYANRNSIKAEVRVRQRRRDHIIAQRRRVLSPPNIVNEIVFTPSPNDVYQIPKKGEYKHVTQNDSPRGRNTKRENNNESSASLHHPSIDLIFTSILGLILARV